jgi:hypothetical protein
MANETVEKLLKEGLHLRDDILAPMWCPGCGRLILNEANSVRRVFCRHCKAGEELVDVDVQVADGKVIFRRRS